MTSTWTFFIVSVMGVTGVAAMAPSVPVLLRRAFAAKKVARLPTRTLVALAIVQTVLVVLVCSCVGTYAHFALGPLHRLSLRTASWATSLGLGGLVGVLGGICAVVLDRPLVAYLRATPMSVRILYGGLTEEVVMRWGLLSAVLWVVSRVAQATNFAHPNAAAITGIVLVNVAFGAGHLPLLRMTIGERAGSAAALIFIISLPWGWLSLEFGLFSAIAAHITFHGTVEILSRMRR